MTSSKIIPFPIHARPRLVSSAPEKRIEPDASAESTASRAVTFNRPFLLPGMDVPHAPGTFELRRTREALDVMWEAYRVTMRIMLVERGGVQALDVTSADLDAALALDLAAT
jgi:hypothetical protein